MEAREVDFSQVKRMEFPEATLERQEIARNRARLNRVRTYVLDRADAYQSPAKSLGRGYWYTLVRTPTGWNCDCQGYQYSGMCKHLGALQRRAEREGWNFGVVQPLEET